MGTFEYDADNFRTAAGKSRSVGNQLTSIINTLNSSLTSRGNVWGNDKLGKTFNNGPGGDDGYDASWTATSENVKTMATSMGEFADGQTESADYIDKMEKGNRDGLK
ncbi:hypothetical protein NN3_26070 [Nocardia neocaledoniensis NBRC 108232]|uniref:Excreted virulence factor EspC (Type VII ESX diderm) n=1 Tax=Nocardia neocaledoniensis TaxID=236511 RepID=A0A317NRZ6_9NOCA|nr:hypothetical protein [Nocardia neocaledoniensis]PWV77722.1 hypothetical protein DFR69_103321 [Nocardia neocaledoniensis]GEM31600.1 hypothetical protein NN3_26070 [Nocardia neocaledoniensis NBRC 108232]